MRAVDHNGVEQGDKAALMRYGSGDRTGSATLVAGWFMGPRA